MTIKLERGNFNGVKRFLASQNGRYIASCDMTNDPTSALAWEFFYDFGSGFHATDYPIKRAIANNAKVWLENGPAEFVISFAR